MFKYCKALVSISAAFGIFFRPTATLAKLEYRTFAFVDIAVLPNGYDLLFDGLTEKLRKKAKINMSDSESQAVVRLFGLANPTRLALQYVDESGAKIYLSRSKFTLDEVRRTGAPYQPNVPYVGFVIGYGEEHVPDHTVATKVAELVQDATEVCKLKHIQCRITHRLAGPTRF